ncbi:uncharacterized protein LOC135394629 [Ornithodoros turicata]|uniref:uncharacterized protein LOC135394629 n=1 Tax=Ornithodoros turicata TaxID=34597 RepID=UPI0031390ABF
MEETWTLKRCGDFSSGKTEIPLDSRNVVIGRNVEKRYRVDSVNISRQHACFNLSDDGVWAVQDLRSRNGVYVNGAKIQPSLTVHLAENDTIGFGRPSPCSDDIFVYRLCRNRPPLLKEEALNSTQNAHCPLVERPRAQTEPLAVLEISDDDDSDEPVITEVVLPKRRHRAAHLNAQKPGQQPSCGAPGLPLTVKSEPVTVKSEHTHSQTSSAANSSCRTVQIKEGTAAHTLALPKSEHTHCQTSNATNFPSRTVQVKQEAEEIASELPKSPMCLSATAETPRINIKKEVSCATALQPLETSSSTATEANSSRLKPSCCLTRDSTSHHRSSDGQVTVKQEDENCAGEMDVAQKSGVSLTTSRDIPNSVSSVQETSLCCGRIVKQEMPSPLKVKDEPNTFSCSTVKDAGAAPNMPAQHDTLLCKAPSSTRSNSPKECPRANDTGSFLKDCCVVVQRLDQMLTGPGPCSMSESDSIHNTSTPLISTDESRHADISAYSQSNKVQHSKTNSISSGTLCSVSSVQELPGSATQDCENAKVSAPPPFSLDLGPRLKQEIDDAPTKTLKEVDFSQDDLVIVLSDDDDGEYVPGVAIKPEPEDYDDHICHQNEDDDDDVWIVHESIVKVKTELEDKAMAEAKDTASVLPPDDELVNRLVWDEQNPSNNEQDEGSNHPCGEDRKGKHQESEADPRTAEQDVCDFFPVLSQSFYCDSKSNSTELSGRDKSASPKVPSSSTAPSRAVLVEPLPVPKPNSKKVSLKDKLQKSMNHRVPMPGGGSAVQKKESSDKSPACGTATEKSSKLFYQVNRFPSRAIHLLDVGESIATADVCKNKPRSRGVKPAQGMISKAVERRVDILSGARNAVASAELPSCSTESTSGAASNTTSRMKPIAEPTIRERARKKPAEALQPLPNEQLQKELQLPAKHANISDGPPPKRRRLELQPSWMEHVSNLVQVENTSGPPVLQDDRPRVVRFSSEALTEHRSEQERAEFAERVRAGLKHKKLVKKAPKVSITTFIGYMLGWKVQWFKEQLNSSKIPPLIDMSKVREKRSMYSSFEEYVYMHYNFLCLESWYQVFNDWRDYFSKTSKMTFNVAVTEHSLAHRTDNAVENITQLTCNLVVKPEAVKKGAYPLEGHFVRIDLRVQDNPRVVIPVFGFIVQHKLNKNTCPSKASLPQLLQGEYSDDCVVGLIKVHVKARSFALNLNKAMRLIVVSKISPILRQVEAILDLDKSPFMQSIIRPNPQHFWSRRGPLNSSVLSDYNKEQAEVISSSLLAMKAPGKETRIVILHGPPGTGKTRTLLGIVLEIIRHCENQRLLVVAPSNTAVDEIGRRLLMARAQQARAGEPIDNVLKIVRVGQEHMIHNEVRGIWLEELLQKNIQKQLKEKTQEFDCEIQAKQSQVRQCQARITALMSSACRDFRNIRRLEFEAQHLKTEILRITEKKRAFVEESMKHSRNYYERKIVLLQKAHIVLSTINSCRSRLLEEAFGRSSPHSFTCVIADEATQCTEVELLLALQYRANRLILVGDPLQLPATVLSREAVELNFQQSLFERFYGYLKESANSQPIFLLTQQCRMQKEICSFPSRYFYEGKLWPTKGLDESYASFPLIPYIVFNVANSPEMTEGTTSWMNHGEAQFVILLCDAVVAQCGSNVTIGVITPYQAQKNLIASRLGANSLIDVNTIDGFQGQERDVVILSCVRAYHPRGSIGFVADARRLNVAITRARKALYICGHLQSLEDSAEWAALIQDGVTRNKVRNVMPEFSPAIARHIITKLGAQSH